MSRSLTEAEVRVIGALLASARVTERTRLQRAAVPRSTYHAARRRAYLDGWLRDRYIPDPVQFGLPIAVFQLVRPFADRSAAYVASRTADPGLVYLAHSPTTALSIGWYPDEETARAAASTPSEAGFASWSFALVTDLRSPSVPVYFDFEGSFAHLGGDLGPEGYPQGLGGTAMDPRRAGLSGAQLRDSWAARELVHRPFPAEVGTRAPHRVGPLGLPWGQQRMLNQGWVRHRVLLDPAQLPPFRGRSTGQQVLIVGSFRGEAHPEELFHALTRSGRVFPYLFATDGRRLLLGALGQPPGAELPDKDRGGRPSVLRLLQERVEGIEILQEPAPGFRTELDHRYDRLFPMSTRMVAGPGTSPSRTE